MKTLPVKLVRAILSYDPNTGILRWKKRKDIPAIADRRVGKIAGSLDKDGYTHVEIYDKRYPGHRIIWAIVTGRWPKKDIDHINGIRTDNRWNNLRLATRQQNLRNMKLRATNKSGFKWVSWCKATNSWKAQIRNGITNLHLGVFKTPEEAHAVARAKAEEFHKEFARFK
jgi:hypothetical protein